MRTVGQILKEIRESKLLTLEDIEKHTKIRKELLEALEGDNFEKLPPSTFVQGFIKNYGKFLGLDSEKLLAIFRRDFEARKHPPLVMESFSNPLSPKKLQITPSRVLIAVVTLIVLIFFTYLWISYRHFIGAPTLEVLSPQEGQTVDIPSVIVEGKTDPEVKVMVNNQEIGIDSDGKFKEEVKLSASANTIIITATSKFGQEAKVERTVILKNK
ncbi:helix-turn-helix domain-containing protein [Candidatus Daviesbacteria bacterium]|nr:helix-turn-helix domain-containing protein [Candidatus Daviesbacteria bacterium]